MAAVASRCVIDYTARVPVLSRAIDRRSRICTRAAVLALAGWTAATALAQLAPAIPSSPSLAAGTLQLGKTTVTLEHAYALGPMDMGGKLYQVVLTDSPVTPNGLTAQGRKQIDQTVGQGWSYAASWNALITKP